MYNNDSEQIINNNFPKLTSIYIYIIYNYNNAL